MQYKNENIAVKAKNYFEHFERMKNINFQFNYSLQFA